MTEPSRASAAGVMVDRRLQRNLHFSPVSLEPVPPAGRKCSADSQVWQQFITDHNLRNERKSTFVSMSISTTGDEVEDILAELDGYESTVPNNISNKQAAIAPQKASSALQSALKQVTMKSYL
jgi:hypothetical protein